MVGAPIDIDNTVDVDWENLLSWLETFDSDIKKDLCVYSKQVPGAGRGLFVNKSVPPGSPLFSVPSAAYLNPLTLSKIYEPDARCTLTATQLISLHLYLFRPTLGKGYEPDPTYGPYLAMFPSDFASHPLSWLTLGTNQALLDYLPPSVKRDVHKVASRFEKDWAAVSRYIGKIQYSFPLHIPYGLEQQTKKQDVKDIYGHGLMVCTFTLLAKALAKADRIKYKVNTRSLYLQLYPSKTDPNNVILCPLVDLANHSSLKHQTTSRTPFPTFYSPLQSTLQAGDQIYLRYGSHNNSTLFTEYGFVEKGYPNGGQVDIQDIIEDQFKFLGDLGDWMESLLKSFNFWGDWILYDSPPPASPSYRLLPALRLLNLSDTFSPNIVKVNDPFSSSAELHAWRNTVYGEQDIVSMSNEDAVWHFLLSICDSVISRAKKGLENLKTIGLEGNLPEWHAYVVECIEQLWSEELQVAEAVAQSIKSGETGHGTL